MKKYKITKIEVWATYLLPKITPLPTWLTKTNMALAKHVIDFYISLRDAILSLTKKKMR